MRPSRRALSPREHLAAIVHVVVVPFELRDHPVIHADVEVRQNHDRCLQALGEIECLDGGRETLVRIRREQQHVLGVAVRGICTRENVRLLCARRHARRRTGALDVENDCRYLRIVAETDELAHQRDARPARRGERSRAHPVRPEHHTDRRKLVLGLDDRIRALARFRIDAILRAKSAEAVHQRRRRRDRIPRADRRTGIQAAQPPLYCRR